MVEGINSNLDTSMMQSGQSVGQNSSAPNMNMRSTAQMSRNNMNDVTVSLSPQAINMATGSESVVQESSETVAQENAESAAHERSESAAQENMENRASGNAGQARNFQVKKVDLRV